MKTLFLSSQKQSSLQSDCSNNKNNKVDWLARFGFTFVIALSLTGCDKLKQIALHRNVDTTASTTASTTSAANPSTEHTQSQATPVVYPINEWNQETLASKVNIRDIEAVKSLLGQPISIDTRSLDYRSNIATKYSFAKVGEPYFDLLDSPLYLELQWYYANAHDNSTIKKISVNHAKTAFHFTQNWFGQNGSDIIANMVQGQPIKNKSYHGMLVEVARCENYHCDLVIKKPALATKAKKKRG